MAYLFTLVLALLQVVPHSLWACTQSTGMAMVSVIQPCVEADDFAAMQPTTAPPAAREHCCTDMDAPQAEAQPAGLCCISVDQLATAGPAIFQVDYNPIAAAVLPLPAMTLVPLVVARLAPHGMATVPPDPGLYLVDPRLSGHLLV